MRPYIKQIAVLLLQRLQNSKTERYVKKLTVFFGLISNKLGSDFLIHFIDEVQDGLFQQIWGNFIITTLPTIGNLLDRKIALIGVLNMVINGQFFQSKYPTLISSTMNSIIETASSQSIANLKNDYVDLDNLEEISTFGSHFSKLVSISEKPFDPLPEIDVNNGVRLYVAEALNKYNAISGNTFLNTILPQLTQENQVKLNQLLVGN